MTDASSMDAIGLARPANEAKSRAGTGAKAWSIPVIVLLVVGAVGWYSAGRPACIVVTSRAVPAGTVLTNDDVKKSCVGDGTDAGDAMRDESVAVGRLLVDPAKVGEIVRNRSAVAVPAHYNPAGKGRIELDTKLAVPTSISAGAVAMATFVYDQPRPSVRVFEGVLVLRVTPAKDSTMVVLLVDHAERDAFVAAASGGALLLVG